MIPSEMYDSIWLRDIQIHLRAAKSVVPVFEIGDDDPQHIVKIKNDLINLTVEIDRLTLKLYTAMERMKDESINKEH